MKKYAIIWIMLLTGAMAGCNNLPAEKLPEIPQELKPILRCSHEIKHISGHKILVFEYSNCAGRQMMVLDLGKVEGVNP